MSTITSCTLLGSGPALRLANSSPPTVAPEAIARFSSQRRPRSLSVCCAKGEHNPKTDLHPFSIAPYVLVHPVPQREEREERWQIEEEANRVNLWFEVPGQSKEDLAVEIDEDVLVIKKKTKPVAEEENMNKQNGRRDPKRNDPRQPGSPAAKGATAPDGNVIYARLLLPGGYSKEGVEAELKSGVLRVSLAKVKKEARRKISIEIINVK